MRPRRGNPKQRKTACKSRCSQVFRFFMNRWFFHWIAVLRLYASWIKNMQGFIGYLFGCLWTLPSRFKAYPMLPHNNGWSEGRVAVEHTFTQKEVSHPFLSCCVHDPCTSEMGAFHCAGWFIGVLWDPYMLIMAHYNPYNSLSLGSTTPHIPQIHANTELLVSDSNWHKLSGPSVADDHIHHVWQGDRLLSIKQCPLPCRKDMWPMVFLVDLFTLSAEPQFPELPWWCDLVLSKHQNLHIRIMQVAG